MKKVLIGSMIFSLNLFAGGQANNNVVATDQIVGTNNTNTFVTSTNITSVSLNDQTAVSGNEPSTPSNNNPPSSSIGMTLNNSNSTSMVQKIKVTCLDKADAAAAFPSVVVGENVFSFSTGLKTAYNYCKTIGGMAKLSTVTVEVSNTINVAPSTAMASN